MFLAGGAVVAATGRGGHVPAAYRPCPLPRSRSCCSSPRVAPDRASASVTRALTAGARCRVMARRSASVGSGAKSRAAGPP